MADLKCWCTGVQERAGQHWPDQKQPEQTARKGWEAQAGADLLLPVRL